MFFFFLIHQLNSWWITETSFYFIIVCFLAYMWKKWKKKSSFIFTGTICSQICMYMQNGSWTGFTCVGVEVLPSPLSHCAQPWEGPCVLKPDELFARFRTITVKTVDGQDWCRTGEVPVGSRHPSLGARPRKRTTQYCVILFWILLVRLEFSAGVSWSISWSEHQKTSPYHPPPARKSNAMWGLKNRNELHSVLSPPYE